MHHSQFRKDHSNHHQKNQWVWSSLSSNTFNLKESNKYQKTLLKFIIWFFLSKKKSSFDQTCSSPKLLSCPRQLKNSQLLIVLVHLDQFHQAVWFNTITNNVIYVSIIIYVLHSNNLIFILYLNFIKKIYALYIQNNIIDSLK